MLYFFGLFACRKLSTLNGALTEWVDDGLFTEVVKLAPLWLLHGVSSVVKP